MVHASRSSSVQDRFSALARPAAQLRRSPSPSEISAPDDPDPISSPFSRVNLAFWFLGLINNFTFTLFMAAAENIMEGYAGVILLCSVVPGFVGKLVFSFFADRMSYPLRIVAVAIFASASSLVVAYADTTPGKPPVVALAALAINAFVGSLGEISFLALTSFFPTSSVAAWSSGTGAAGVAGAGLFVFLTQALGLSAKLTLTISAVFPLQLILIFQALLAGPYRARAKYREAASRRVDDDLEHDLEHDLSLLANRDESPTDNAGGGGEGEIEGGGVGRGRGDVEDDDGGNGDAGDTDDADKVDPLKAARSDELETRVQYFGHLFRTYMLPLSLVYFSEYTINHGVLGTLNVFRDKKTHEATTTYSNLQLTYQLAVCFSRSSISFFQVPYLYIMSSLQFVNLIVLTLCSIYVWLPSFHFAVLFVLWEGLLGGLTYVNAFYRLRASAPQHLQEWALATATVADVTGIAVASVVASVLEQVILKQRTHSHP